MEADGDRFVLPGERRVGHDDGQLREIHRYIVYMHGVAVFQTDAAAARHVRADSAVTGVKEHGQFGFGENLVERVGDRVVGEELLQWRMQF